MARNRIFLTIYLAYDLFYLALIAEIKEISEKNQNEDEMVLSVAAGYTQPIKPHMQFEYPDLNIQEDIHQLIKYSCGEVCTPEQLDKVMKIWTTFLEPLLGVPSCPPGAADKKYVVKDSNHTEKNSKHIGKEDSGHADEVAYCKPADMSKSGDEHIPPEDSFPSRARMTCGNNGNVNDGSPGADNDASKSDILCNASPTAAGEKNTSKENASTTWKGNLFNIYSIAISNPLFLVLQLELKTDFCLFDLLLLDQKPTVQMQIVGWRLCLVKNPRYIGLFG